jgi:hypothetical protein
MPVALLPLQILFLSGAVGLTASIDFQCSAIQGAGCTRQPVSNPRRGETRKIQKTNSACILIDIVERLRAICRRHHSHVD